MIPYDLDPSLHTRAPQPPSLEDGFSPPVADTRWDNPDPRFAEEIDPLLWNKSLF
ncbi:MAG: hypothetical protein H0X13_19505 [Ramlibacter sp.]|nr:hypothetical protein [Ramlibacter sp.]